MSARIPRVAWLLAFLAVSALPWSQLPAQTLPPSLGAAATADLQEGQAVPPPLPAYRCPVDLFRQLLLMSPEDRQKAIADRPAETRAALLDKVREYQSLPPKQRELRLKATELRFYLVPLLNTPATNRQGQLALIPQDDRTLVTDRLREWDCLSPAQQKDLLANVALLQYLTELQSGSEEHQKWVRENVPAVTREKLERSIARWRSLPADQRGKIIIQFERVFKLTIAEQEKVLQTLSEPERQEMEKTLSQFRALPPPQRAVCVNSFEKFASMTAEERARFLKNAEQWRQMTPEQRQAWRNLVRNLPPLPPGFGSAIAPPLPPGAIPPTPSLVTNGN
jgi:hypothetical protein